MPLNHTIGHVRHMSSSDAYAQCKERYGTDNEISVSAAATIAALWAAPSNPNLTALAQGRYWDYHELMNEIHAERVHNRLDSRDNLAFDMLSTFALAIERRAGYCCTD